MFVCTFNDWLPPGFVFRSSSPTGDIDRDPDALIWESSAQGYRANWIADQWPENGGNYIMSIGAGLSKSFSFQVATPEQGVNYFNWKSHLSAGQEVTPWLVTFSC